MATTANSPTTNNITFTPARSEAQALEAWGLVALAYHRIGIVPDDSKLVHTTPHLFTNESVTILGR